MKRILFGFIILVGILFGAESSYAATAQSTWRWNFSSNCQGLSGSYSSKDLCFETGTASIYICSPNAGVNGTCTTSAEWKLSGGLWLDNGTATYLKTPRNVLIGNKYIQGSSTAGLGIDANGDNSVDVIVFPTGLVSSPAGFEYTGNDAFGNVNRTTDQSANTLGNYWFNTSTLRFNYYNGTAIKQIPTTLFETIPIPTPTQSTNRLWFKAPYGMRIEGINCIVDPADSSESAVVSIQQCDSSGDNCANIDTSTITCGNAGAADDGSISSPNISSGNWVNINVGTVTGTVSNLTITAKYTVNVP